MKTTHYLKTLLVLSLSLTAQFIHALDKTVALGSSIQTAIDQVTASGGGIVTLAAGTHTITSTIKIKSNVTLQGSGTYASRIFTSADINMIEADKEGLVNLVFQNFEMIGSPTKNAGGIQVTSQGTDHDNIKILNVRCYETGWGVHIKGAKNLTIENCDFSRNGNPESINYAHNLYLRRITGAVVKNSSFNYGTSSNGINISYSANIQIMNCQMIGNHFRGVRAADTDGFLVHDCLVINNGNVGILANTEVVVTTNVDFQNNCVYNNGFAEGNAGIETKNGATGTCKNNNVFGNSTNYKLVSSVTQSGNTSDATKPCIVPKVCEHKTSIFEAECYNTMSGIKAETTNEGGQNIGFIETNDWAMYSNIDLTNMNSLVVRGASKNTSGGTVEIRIDNLTGTVIGTLDVASTGDWQKFTSFTAGITKTSGKHDVYMIFKGGTGSLMNVNWFAFSPLTAPIVTAIASDQETNTVSFYPNPVSDRMYIQNNAGNKFEMYNNTGQLIYSGLANSDKHLVDLSNYSPAMYLLKITKADNSFHFEKIIKE